MKKPKRKAHNWPAIKADYVEGWQNGSQARHMPALPELAKKHGVHLAQVKKKAAAEGWFDQRNRLAAEMERSRQSQLVVYIAKAGAKFDSACLRTAKTHLRIGRGLMARVIADMRGPKPDMDALTLQFSRISTGLEKVQRMGRVAIAANGDDGALDLWSTAPDTPEALTLEREQAPIPEEDEEIEADA
jgi:hypothetical protein